MTILIREIIPPPERIVLSLLGSSYSHRMYHVGAAVAIDVSDPTEKNWILEMLRGCSGIAVTVDEHTQSKFPTGGIDNAGD